MTNSYVKHYSLNPVQRELDFSNANVNLSTQNKFNNPYYNKNSYLTNNIMATSNNITTKSLSFCNNYNIQSPTGMNINLNSNEYRPRTITLNMNHLDNRLNTLKIKEESNNTSLSSKVNIENVIIGKDKRTTVMLRNIPNKYSLQNLVDEINSSFWGKFDYVNLPIDYSVTNLKNKILEKAKFGLCVCEFC